MNIDKDNDEIQSENPFVFFNRGEVFYKLKYSNLPIKLKMMLIKKFNEVVVSQKEIEDFNDKVNHPLSYIIREYDYNSIENPPLIYEELDYIIEDRSDIEKEKDFFNYKGIEYKPIDPEKTKKARDMLYKVTIRHMSCTDLSEHELRFIAEGAMSLEQMQRDNPFIINVWQQNALHLAVINNNMQEVKDILTKDKSMLGLKDRWGSIALHYAVELALLDITKYLIEEGANVFERNSDGDTLLHLATIEGNKDMISYLLEKGLDIDAKDNKSRTPLKWTVLMNKREILNYLIEKEVKCTDILEFRGGNLNLIINYIEHGGKFKSRSPLEYLKMAVKNSREGVEMKTFHEGEDTLQYITRNKDGSFNLTVLSRDKKIIYEHLKLM